MALEPLVGARGGVRVCFYLLSTHLNGLASVLCVFLLSKNHHAGSYQQSYRMAAAAHGLAMVRHLLTSVRDACMLLQVVH